MPKKPRTLNREIKVDEFDRGPIVPNLGDALAKVEGEFCLRPGTLQYREPVLSIPLPLEGYKTEPRTVNAMDCCGPQLVQTRPDRGSISMAVSALFDEVSGLAVAVDDLEGRLAPALRCNPKADNTARPAPVGSTKHAQELLEITDRICVLRIKLIDITTRIDL